MGPYQATGQVVKDTALVNDYPVLGPKQVPSE